jgi:hypothetical protein
VDLENRAVPDRFLIPLQVSLALAILLLYEARLGEGIEIRFESQQSVRQPVRKTLSVAAATWLATSAFLSHLACPIKQKVLSGLLQHGWFSEDRGKTSDRN